MKEKLDEKGKINEEEEISGERLLRELGREAIRVSREAVRADSEKKLDLIIASNLLNHAQKLAGIDDTKGRRLLGQVRRLIRKN
jgi:hypothetical protein